MQNMIKIKRQQHAEYNQVTVFNAKILWRVKIYLIGYKFEKLSCEQIKGTGQGLSLISQARKSQHSA